MGESKRKKRKKLVFIVVGHWRGKRSFIGLFLGFLLALGDLILIGHGEEDSCWESSNFFFLSCGLGGPIPSGLVYLNRVLHSIPLKKVSSLKLSVPSLSNKWGYLDFTSSSSSQVASLSSWLLQWIFTYGIMHRLRTCSFRSIIRRKNSS